MSLHASFEEILQAAQELHPAEKAKLVKALTSAPASGLDSNHRSLRGLLKGSPLSKEEIDENRRELWAGFPREIP